MFNRRTNALCRAVPRGPGAKKRRQKRDQEGRKEAEKEIKRENVSAHSRLSTATIALTLNSEDRSSSRNVARVGDVSGGSEVGGNSDVLDDLRKSEERGDIGVGERVLAALRGVLDTGSLETGSEESDVGGFIGGDLLKDGVDARVAGSVERSLVELGESYGLQR